MKYTDSKNSILFNDVKEAGVYHASGPIGLNGKYETNGDTIVSINDVSLLNALDIDWNGALVEPNVFLYTTGDLLRWIKSKQSGGGTIDISIDENGYWCINGISIGIKARGENGLTPYIGNNGNWWIGDSDTGVPASTTATLETEIKYITNYPEGSNNTYRLGILKVGNQQFPIIGKESLGDSTTNNSQIVLVLTDLIYYTPSVTASSLGAYPIGTFCIGNKEPITIYGMNTTRDEDSILNITNIFNLEVTTAISYIPTVGNSTEGSYEIGKLKIGSNDPISIYGKDIFATVLDFYDSLNEPIASINLLHNNPNSNNSLLLYSNNNWSYKTLNEAGEILKNYFTENNYWNINNTGPSEFIKSASVSGNTLTLTNKNNGVTTFTPNNEPSTYIKSALVNGNTITFTKKDNSTLSFTPNNEPSAYIKNVSISGNTVTFTKKDNSSLSFTPSVEGPSITTQEVTLLIGNNVTVTPASMPLGVLTIEIGTIQVGNTSKTLHAPYEPSLGIPDDCIVNASVSGNTLTLTKHNNSTVTFTPSSGTGGSEPAEYLKSVTSNGNTLTFIKKDNTTWSFTPSGTGGGGDTVSVPYAYGLGENRIKIASIKVNSNTTDIYAPLSTGGGGETTYIENPYDDSWILGAIDDAINQLDHDLSEALLLLRGDLTDVLTNFETAKEDLQDSIDDLDDQIAEVNKIANGEWDRLTDFTSALDNEIKNKVENLLDDALWIQLNWPDGGGSTSNFGEEDVEAYLLRIGVWSRNNDVTKTQWSDIVQKVDTIELAVNAMSSSGDITEALLASITEAVNSGIASLNLETMYAKKEAENVIEWMYSALRNQTSSDYTFNLIVSAGKNNLSNAISEIRTAVTKTQDGTFVASANIETVVDNAISGLRTSTTGNSAKTYIFNKINTNSDDISAIISAATADASGTTIANKFANYRSGAVFRSAVDSAIANLLTTSGSTASGLMLKSTWDSAQANLITTNNISGYISGLLAKSDLSSAITQLLASTNTSSAAVNLRSGLDSAIASLISSTGNSISGLTTKSYVDNANASLLSSISDTYATKSSLGGYATTTALAGVSTEVTNIKNNYVAKTSLGSEIKTAIDNDGTIVNKIISSGGIVTTATIDSACATVFAQNGTARAGIVAAVLDNKSSIGLTADDITINSSHKLNLTSSNCTISSDLINIDTSNLSVDADHINFSTSSSRIHSLSDTNEMGLSGRTFYLYDLSNDYNMMVQPDHLVFSEGNYDLVTLTVRDGGGIATSWITADSLTIGDYITLGNGIVNAETIRLNDGSEYGNISYNASPDHEFVFDSGATFGYDVNINGSLWAQGGSLNGSDERLKENLVNKSASIDDIANVRLVDFNYIGKEEKYFGSIAQDWQSIFPNAIKETKKGYLGLDYGAVALGSAVTAAREIVILKEKVLTLEEENQNLKDRLAVIEATLERINNALG